MGDMGRYFGQFKVNKMGGGGTGVPGYLIFDFLEGLIFDFVWGQIFDFLWGVISDIDFFGEGSDI